MSEAKPEEVKVEEKKEVKEEKKAEKKVEKKVEKKEEKKEEEKPKKDRKDMTIAEIIEDAVDSELAELPMTPRVKVLLKKLPKVDEKHLNNIETFFKVIVEDKKIDMKDVPACMSLIQELFILYESLRTKVSSADIGSLLETVVKLLILYRVKDTKVLSGEQEESVMKSLDILIALAVEMMDLKELSKKVNSRLNKLINGVKGLFTCVMPSFPKFSTSEPKKEEGEKEEGEKKEEDKKEEPKAEEKKA